MAHPVEERVLTQGDRVVAFREGLDKLLDGTNLVRLAAHCFLEAELVGAQDVAQHQYYELHRACLQLEHMFTVFSGETLEEGHLNSPRPTLPESTTPDSHPAAVSSGSPPDLALARAAKGGRRVGVDVIASRIREARMNAGLSLQDVANGGGISRVAIHLIETGKTRPSVDTLIHISKRLNRPIGYFTGEMR